MGQSFRGFKEWIERQTVNEINISFSDLERESGFPISPVYLNKKTFQQKSSKYRKYAEEADYYIDSVDYIGEMITFKKGTSPSRARTHTPSHTGGPVTLPPRRRRAVSCGYSLDSRLNYSSPMSRGGSSAIIDALGVSRRLISPKGNLVDLTEANSIIVERQIPLGLFGRRGFPLAKPYLPNALNVYKSLCPKDAAGNPILNRFDFTNRVYLRQVLVQIDKDNGTRDVALSAGKPRRAVDTFCDFILDTTNDFLRNLDGNAIQIKALVENMKRAHTYYDAKSLASKVCKYLHQFYYNEDKFFINDKVVRSVLPYYLDALGIPHAFRNTSDVDSLSYGDLYDYLNRIYITIPRFRSGRRMTKTEFDHILWYCYRDFDIKN